MVRENLHRNLIIHKLWEDGLTINEIASETGIPRSTVGYYVRKFNMRARRGEPIAYLPARDRPKEKDLAKQAFLKNLSFQQLCAMLQEAGGLDKVYKLLMTVKLMKELQRDIFPTEEERQALLNNIDHIISLLIKSKPT